MEQAIYTLLSTASSVYGLVGGASNPRIAPLKRFQGEALSAITYTVVSDVPINTMSGGTGAFKARLQIDCWAVKYSDAKAIRDAVYALLNGYKGTVAGIAFGHILMEDRRDNFIPPIDASDIGVRSMSLDFNVFYHT